MHVIVYACQRTVSNAARDSGIRGNGPYFARKYAGRLGIVPEGVNNALNRILGPLAGFLMAIEEVQLAVMIVMALVAGVIIGVVWCKWRWH